MNAGGQDSDITDEGRGSSYVSGRMDTIIRLTKKTMNFKGRSVEDTRVNIVQDKDTGLVHLVESSAKLEQLTLKVMRDNPEWTKHAQAKEVALQSGSVSYKTVERLIDKLQKLSKAA